MPLEKFLLIFIIKKDRNVWHAIEAEEIVWELETRAGSPLSLPDLESLQE